MRTTRASWPVGTSLEVIHSDGMYLVIRWLLAGHIAGAQAAHDYPVEQGALERETAS